MRSDVRPQHNLEKEGFRCAKAGGCAAFVKCSSERLGTINHTFETAIRLALLSKLERAGVLADGKLDPPSFREVPSVNSRLKKPFIRRGKI